MAYLVLNGTITVALLPFGPDLYGYGSMIASAVSLLLGFRLVLRELFWLQTSPLFPSDVLKIIRPTS